MKNNPVKKFPANKSYRKAVVEIISVTPAPMVHPSLATAKKTNPWTLLKLFHTTYILGIGSGVAIIGLIEDCLGKDHFIQLVQNSWTPKYIGIPLALAMLAIGITFSYYVSSVILKECWKIGNKPPVGE